MEAILGIDLGTTNSEVAVIRGGKADVLREDGEAILPSVVGLDAEGRLLVGAAARNQSVLAPERTVRSIKRKMGSGESVRLGDQPYTPQEISAFILRKLKERAEKVLGQPARKAVITVPAFFNEKQREATREAGELAGLEVVRIINEPTAASLTYNAHPERMERLAVYDLGGGTFDVSIVQIEQGVVEVLASHGDTHLGGDDFDQILLDMVCDEFQREHDVDLRASLAARSRLLWAVEAAKKRLSTEPVAVLQEEFLAETKGKPLHLTREIYRGDYEERIRPLLDKTLRCLDAALADARLHANQIDKVILVGGATRTPLVHQLLEEQLGQPVHAEVDPDLCVAMGAAIQGGLIAGIDVGAVLVDITPHTLGIQSLGTMSDGSFSEHHFTPLIERNTPLPASRSDLFATVYDGQEQAQITVFQGESEDVRDNESVGEFFLNNLAEVRRGNEILVRFDLDLDGILKVTAVERATGRQEQLTIDNAVTRFRASNREEALARVEATFLGSPGAKHKIAARGAAAVSQAAGAGAQALDADWPEELAPLAARCRRLIAQGRDLAPRSDAEDAREIVELAGQLEAAVAERSAEKMETLSARLDDLIFYLQDA